MFRDDFHLSISQLFIPNLGAPDCTLTLINHAYAYMQLLLLSIKLYLSLRTCRPDDTSACSIGTQRKPLEIIFDVEICGWHTSGNPQGNGWEDAPASYSIPAPDLSEHLVKLQPVSVRTLWTDGLMMSESIRVCPCLLRRLLG
jgi:hypothetical protein